MNRFTLFVRTMAPGWFAAVMGTAVTSLALTLFSKTFAWAALPAEIFHWAAVVMMTVLGAAAVLRLVFFPKAVLHTVSHPVEGAFYATFPIALLVMAAEWTVRAEPLSAVAWLWWPGVVGTFLSSFVILSLLFAGKSLTLDQVTPGHFIPAVGLVVIPVAGAGLAAPAEGLMREVYFGVNMVGFGAGVFMYVGLTALTMARHFLGAPIVGKMTPTLWVHLAPLAVIPLSMLALLHAVGDASLIRYGTLVASAFMGAALWWMVIAAVLTLKNLREGKLPFAISWWAFVFPVGALTVLALRLSAMMELALLPWVTAGLGALLAFFWTAAAVGTIRGLLTGSILNPPEVKKLTGAVVPQPEAVAAVNAGRDGLEKS